MGRLDYQAKWAKGRVVNIGCGDRAVDFGPDSVNVDIDVWDFPNFVRADCHNLPFKDKSFDTAVLGDVLEHCLNPIQAIKEAARVAKRLVLTIPEELNLPSVGQHIAIGIKLRADSYRKYYGFPDTMSDDDVIIQQKRRDPRFKDAMPESLIAHDGHINRFDDKSVMDLIQHTGMKVTDFQKVPEGPEGVAWMNWLITLDE